MTFRISTQSTFNRFLFGLRDARYRSAVAQEQLSSGLRINRASDDPTGAARSLTFQRRLAGLGRQADSIASGRTTLDAAASALQQASDLVSETRALIVQGLNGTLSSDDRQSLASEIGILRDQLLAIANQRVGDAYLFGGTDSGAPPWEESTVGGHARAVYRGNEEAPLLRIGDGQDVAVGLPGSGVFGDTRPTGAVLNGDTGLALGTTANQGSGYERILLRHDGVDPGALASVGVAAVGSGDTLLGTHALVIDTTAGTVRLGNGPERALPAPGDPEASDFVLANEGGGELHLDFTGFTGADYSGTVTGQGSISIDGTTYTPLTFGETDLELVHPASGSIVHVDTTGLARSGEELVTFGGTLNLFDLLEGLEEDLRSAAELSPQDLQQRLQTRLGELDGSHERLLVAAGTLGATSQRLAVSGERVQGLEVQVQGLLSRTQDADISEVAIELAKTDLSLQLAQSAGARLLQTTLLNFLG